MKISTEIDSTALRFGEEKAVELVGKAGFDAWDLSMFPMCVLDKNGKVTPGNTHPFASKDYLKFVRRLKQIGLDNGIVCNQSHAPFPSPAAMQPYLIDEVTAALREINYQGYITLEADSYLKSFPKDADEKKVFEGLKVLAAAARRLADMVEAR